MWLGVNLVRIDVSEELWFIQDPNGATSEDGILQIYVCRIKKRGTR
jgi:hypothetical protein